MLYFWVQKFTCSSNTTILLKKHISKLEWGEWLYRKNKANNFKGFLGRSCVPCQHLCSKWIRTCRDRRDKVDSWHNHHIRNSALKTDRQTTNTNNSKWQHITQYQPQQLLQLWAKDDYIAATYLNLIWRNRYS